jgi:glycosyltransferase involved in cell wall biosynthesis
MSKILFVHSSDETFVKLDRELLGASFELIDLYLARKFPHNLIQYWRGINEADILFCWFASWNSFWALLIARLIRKPSILVIGGYDVANLPVADYGHQRGGLKKKISRWAMALASVLIPFSEYSKHEAEKNAGIDAGRMKVIYLGVPDWFISLPLVSRERMVLTVGKVEWANMKRKGLEPFVRTALELPDVNFILVGEWADDSIEFLRSIASANVTFAGQVSRSKLVEYYQRAAVYIQVSLHEGFGLSVAEAMLAGCIPVVTRVGSLPEVVGDCGFFTASSEPTEVARAIQAAFYSDRLIGQKARKRILGQFPMQKRGLLLKQIVDTLLVSS